MPEPGASAVASTLPQIMQQAIAAYSRRDWVEAERLGRLILKSKADHFEALSLLGIIAAQTQRMQESAALLARAVAANPNDPYAHNNCGNALKELKRLDEALESFERALKINPDYAEAYSNRAVTLRELGRLDEALDSFERALTIRPDYPEAWNNRGVTLKELNRLDEALDSFDQALKVRPGYAEACSNRGVTLRELGRLDEALASFDRALTIRPDHAEAYINRGHTLQELKRLDEALDSYDRALKIKPDRAEAHSNRGLTLQALKRLDEALDSYDRALKLKPGYAEAHFNRGSALKELKRLDEALESYDRALKFKPGYAEVYSNRGSALKELKRPAEALASYDRALEIKPDLAEAHFNRGNLLIELKRPDEALASYDRALEINPDYADARFNRSLCCLAMGDLARGWEGYEWRWRSKQRSNDSRRRAEPWDGGTIRGPLLVLPEQGIGDEIFHAGMLNDLEAHGPVTVCVDPRLVALYRRSFDHILVVPSTAPLTGLSFEAQIHAASLGRYFRASEHALKNIRVPYLKACPDRVRSLRSQLASDGKLICGLSWISRNAEVGTEKSLSLQRLESILALPGIEFVNLQYGDTDAEQAALQARSGLSLKNVPEVDNFSDIDGLAALIEACDLVVTVSNMTAHLAGALGKRALVMLPFSVGLLWCWHMDREDSPWYPSARLLRQSSPGDWESVLERLRAELTRSE